MTTMETNAIPSEMNLEEIACTCGSNVYDLGMAVRQRISEQLRHAIEQCGESRYRLSKETGVSQSILSRFINGEMGLNLENIDRLCEYLGARLVVDPKPRPQRITKKGK